MCIVTYENEEMQALISDQVESSFAMGNLLIFNTPQNAHQQPYMQVLTKGNFIKIGRVGDKSQNSQYIVWRSLEIRNREIPTLLTVNQSYYISSLLESKKPENRDLVFWYFPTVVHGNDDDANHKKSNSDLLNKVNKLTLDPTLQYIGVSLYPPPKVRSPPKLKLKKKSQAPMQQNVKPIIDLSKVRQQESSTVQESDDSGNDVRVSGNLRSARYRSQNNSPQISPKNIHAQASRTFQQSSQQLSRRGHKRSSSYQQQVSSSAANEQSGQSSSADVESNITLDSKDPEPIFTKQPQPSNTPKFKHNKRASISQMSPLLDENGDPIEKHRLQNNMVLNCDQNNSTSTNHTYHTQLSTRGQYNKNGLSSADEKSCDMNLEQILLTSTNNLKKQPSPNPYRKTPPLNSFHKRRNSQELQSISYLDNENPLNSKELNLHNILSQDLNSIINKYSNDPNHSQQVMLSQRLPLENVSQQIQPKVLQSARGGGGGSTSMINTSLSKLPQQIEKKDFTFNQQVVAAQVKPRKPPKDTSGVRSSLNQIFKTRDSSTKPIRQKKNIQSSLINDSGVNQSQNNASYASLLNQSNNNSMKVPLLPGLSNYNQHHQHNSTKNHQHHHHSHVNSSSNQNNNSSSMPDSPQNSDNAGSQTARVYQNNYVSNENMLYQPPIINSARNTNSLKAEYSYYNSGNANNNGNLSQRSPLKERVLYKNRPPASARQSMSPVRDYSNKRNSLEGNNNEVKPILSYRERRILSANPNGTTIQYASNYGSQNDSGLEIQYSNYNNGNQHSSNIEEQQQVNSAYNSINMVPENQQRYYNAQNVQYPSGVGDQSSSYYVSNNPAGSNYNSQYVSQQEQQQVITPNEVIHNNFVQNNNQAIYNQTNNQAIYNQTNAISKPKPSHRRSVTFTQKAEFMNPLQIGTQDNRKFDHFIEALKFENRTLSNRRSSSGKQLPKQPQQIQFEASPSKKLRKQRAVQQSQQTQSSINLNQTVLIEKVKPKPPTNNTITKPIVKPVDTQRNAMSKHNHDEIMIVQGKSLGQGHRRTFSYCNPRSTQNGYC